MPFALKLYLTDESRREVADNQTHLIASLDTSVLSHKAISRDSQLKVSYYFTILKKLKHCLCKPLMGPLSPWSQSDSGLATVALVSALVFSFSSIFKFSNGNFALFKKKLALPSQR